MRCQKLGSHQGVIALVPPIEYAEVDEILSLAKERSEEPFVLILDGIEDVHNLGSIIRTAEAARSSRYNYSKKKGC